MNSESYSDPVRKKSNVGLIIAIVVGLCFLCCAGVGFALFQGFKTATGSVSGMINCGGSLADYRAAIVAYAKKHDGKVPSAKTWQDDVKPFLVHTELPGILKADTKGLDPETICDAGAATGFALNSDFAGKPIKSVDDKDDSVLLFEVGTEGKNQSEKFVRKTFATSPKVFGKSRGWMEVSLHGPAVTIDQTGQRAPISVRQGGSVKVGN